MRAIWRLVAVVGLLGSAAVVAVHAPAVAGKPGPPPPATLTFGGQRWYVKSSSGKVGPGPNLFGAANSFVDGQGLHLRITKDKQRRWQSAEVFAATSLGYGTYTFELASDVSRLDPNVVLGLFTWSDDPAQAHRELDVEVARWGSTTDPTNAQYVVQPYDDLHLRRFSQAAGPSAHSFTWSPGKVAFTSSAQATSWTYTGADVPTPGDEKVHLNLWLMNGSAPTNGQPVEVVVSNFSFTPAAP